MISNGQRRITTTSIESPVGTLTLMAQDGALTRLHMHEQRHITKPPIGAERDDSAFVDAIDQLTAYFAGELTEFDLPLQMSGTDFQQRVWAGLREIPYGETISYADLAREVGSPNAFRAVGSANGRNPLGIIVPCHRVIAADGSLGGYGGGLQRKVWLLEHEAAHKR
jgi:methylated-DNA-[protein]-cysteine S-methyltransferase